MSIPISNGVEILLRYCNKTFCDANIGASIIDFDAENNPIFASFLKEKKISCSDVLLSSFVRATQNQSFQVHSSST